MELCAHSFLYPSRFRCVTTGANWRLLDACLLAAKRGRGIITMNFSRVEGPGMTDLFLGLIALNDELASAELARFCVVGLSEDHRALLNRMIQATRVQRKRAS